MSLMSYVQSRWTPQLLKAFEDATAALGPHAAPAAVLEHMGPAAAGLTRDAVAAHLQKHRSGWAALCLPRPAQGQHIHALGQRGCSAAPDAAAWLSERRASGFLVCCP
jgi:SHAQKYF class myb-like DNA-binding protein